MKQLMSLFILAILFVGCKNENKENETELGETTANVEQQADTVAIEIEPISHATAVIHWGDAVFYTDPTGGAEAFQGKEEADFILITDIHGDHMNVETLQDLNLGTTKIVVPQAVKDELPAEMHSQLVVIGNGETTELMGFSIKGIPMYNLPEDSDSRHIKGRGNGYVVEKDGKRMYIAGDTEDIPEMRNLENIDIALIPMNLPYTMDIESAADGVLAFKPKQVYPYHFRGTEGLADVEKFKELVEQKNEDIEVVLLNWYPNQGQ